MHHKIYLLLTIMLISITATQAQTNVGINTTTPDASAALDVTSTDKGMLVPRMTAAQRGLISAPATGLLVYQTDVTAGFYFFNGTMWTSLSGGGSSLPSQTGNGGKVLTTDGTNASWGNALPPTTQLPNSFMGHNTLTNTPLYTTPFTSTTTTVLSSLTCFLVSNACTLNFTFHSFEDEGVTYELFQVTPVANNSTYSTSGSALASGTTSAWSSGSPLTTSFSFSATANTLYTIKITKTAGGAFSSGSGIFTSFYAN